MRQHARANGLPLADVAAQIVSGDLAL